MSPPVQEKMIHRYLVCGRALIRHTLPQWRLALTRNGGTRFGVPDEYVREATEHLDMPEPEPEPVPESGSDGWDQLDPLDQEYILILREAARNAAVKAAVTSESKSESK